MTEPSDLWSGFAQRGVELQHLATGGAVPLRFGGLDAEVDATRQAAGLFDFSFMGVWDFVGPRACEALMRLQTRNLRTMPVGRIAYTLLLEDSGHVRIDATVWRYGQEAYRVFTGRPSDADYLCSEGASQGCLPVSRVGEYAILAVQGPASAKILRRLLGASWDAHGGALKFFDFSKGEFKGHSLWIGRLGYTGELGYELIVPRALGPVLWQELLHLGSLLGLRECGFEAANHLRIEAGYVLFSQELAQPATAAELGLQRLVDNPSLDFVGRLAHRRLSRDPQRRLVGLRWSHTQGHSGTASCETWRAQVTSISPLNLSPSTTLALGWVQRDRVAGDVVYTQHGQRAQVNRLPFYTPAMYRPRQRVLLETHPSTAQVNSGTSSLP